MLSIFLTLILAVTVGLYFQLSTIYEPYVPIHEERAPVETVWGRCSLTLSGGEKVKACNGAADMIH